MGMLKLANKLPAAIAAVLFGLFFYMAGAGEPQGTGAFIQGVVTRVVDGDTVHVKTKGEDRTVRLVGVDTPETVHPKKPVQFYGREASAFTKKSLANKTVWLEYDVSPLDRYKRHLAYVWLEMPPDKIDEAAIRRGMFNARLLLDGYGRVMTIQPNSRYADLFVKFEREARENNRGLWGEGKKSKSQK
jgi:micrococcal nuclease